LLGREENRGCTGVGCETLGWCFFWLESKSGGFLKKMKIEYGDDDVRGGFCGVEGEGLARDDAVVWLTFRVPPTASDIVLRCSFQSLFGVTFFGLPRWVRLFTTTAGDEIK
jgi:hypothetical protein